MRRLEEMRLGDRLEVAPIRLVGDLILGKRLVGELDRQCSP